MSFGAVKVLFIILFITGLAQPIEPILSIHRAGRMSKLLSQTTPISNDSAGDDFDIDIAMSVDQKSLNKNADHTNHISDVVETSYSRTEALCFAIASASLVGLSGIFPLLIFSRVKSGLVASGKGKRCVLESP